MLNSACGRTGSGKLEEEGDTSTRTVESGAITSGSATFHLGYRPALDGVRGLAVLMVIGAHTFVLPRTFGFIGVELFFALSGFLITSLLVAEWGETGRIDWRAFYARRALRLLPALFAMLILFLAYAAITGPPWFFRHALKEILFALFYCTNLMQAYNDHYFRFLRHTWSLSMEEQFYLIWPAVLLWMLRRGAALPSSAVKLLVTAISGFWFVRVTLFLGTIAFSGRVANSTTLANALHPEALLLGCLAAFALSFGLFGMTPFSRKLLQCGFIASIAGIAWMGFRLDIGNPVMICIGWMLTSLFSAIVVFKLAVIPGTWSRVVFEHPALVYVGKISYGLYLWNSMVMEMLVSAHHWPTWKYFIVGVPTMLVTALGSYYLLELRCLRLKQRFHKVGAVRPLPGHVATNYDRVAPRGLFAKG